MEELVTEIDASGGILVGHDGSSQSSWAVRWAADLGCRLGVQLHVVRTWALSSAPRPSNWGLGYVPSLKDFETAVLEQLRSDVKELQLRQDADVQCHVLHGAAGRRLVESSKGAEMLVVASRGIGGFRGLVIGSTAGQVIGHAECPVVVVPVTAPDQPAEPDAGIERE
jgi:nucleotide-binding universal stress UspA family protein